MLPSNEPGLIGIDMHHDSSADVLRYAREELLRLFGALTNQSVSEQTGGTSAWRAELCGAAGTGSRPRGVAELRPPEVDTLTFSLTVQDGLGDQEVAIRSTARHVEIRGGSPTAVLHVV